MSIKIKATLQFNDEPLTEFVLPQNQVEFDRNLTDNGIYKNVGSEYRISKVTSNLEALENPLRTATDIEELNFLAQLLDRMSDIELECYEGIINAKGIGTDIEDAIGIAYNYNEYNIAPSINVFSALGEQYVRQESPDLDEKIFQNIDFEAVGEEVRLEHNGEMTDVGYISNFNDDFTIWYISGDCFPEFDYESDYALKIKLSKIGREDGVEIILPATETIIDRALTRLGTSDIGECEISKYSSSTYGNVVKFLKCNEDIAPLNTLAKKLEAIPEEKSTILRNVFKEQANSIDADNLIRITDSIVNGSYQSKSDTKQRMEETVRGLTDTAWEKVCVFGDEGAKPFVDKLREQVVDLVQFWDLDEHFIDQFDMDIEAVMNNPTQTENLGMGGM